MKTWEGDPNVMPDDRSRHRLPAQCRLKATLVTTTYLSSGYD